MRRKTATLIAIAASLLFSVLSGAEEIDSASIFSLTGDVKVVPHGSNMGIQSTKGMKLYPGDWVKTGSDSSVTVAFDQNAENVITIEENSLIVIRLDGYFKVQLLRGEMYAILENVEKGKSFRVLAPSVVTESLNSGFGASTDGAYTNVVVFDNKVFICGINEEGAVDKKKYWIEEGYQRKTIKFEDPGELAELPENALPWFKEQVVAHHLAKMMSQEVREEGAEEPVVETQEKEEEGEGKVSGSADDVNLLEYLYKQRLKHSPGKTQE